MQTRSLDVNGPKRNGGLAHGVGGGGSAGSVPGQ